LLPLLPLLWRCGNSGGVGKRAKVHFVVILILPIHLLVISCYSYWNKNKNNLCSYLYKNTNLHPTFAVHFANATEARDATEARGAQGVGFSHPLGTG